MTDTTGQANAALELPSNPLTAYDTGGILDFRFRLAMELLKSGPFAQCLKDGVPYAQVETRLRNIALEACDLAAEMVTCGIARGWIKPLPPDDDLDERTRTQLRRNTRAGVYGQIVAQEIGQQEAPRVAPAALSGVKGPLRGN